ncbi:hypothetical protein V2S84_03090 [Azotobacter chroococcum]|nr:hypothetical protein [Azotobacter chroococcum]
MKNRIAMPPEAGEDRQAGLSSSDKETLKTPLFTGSHALQAA